MALYRCWSTSDGGGGAPLDGDAQESEVLLGKTFYSDSAEKKTGTMPNNGKVDVTLDPDEEWTIPEGYHDGTGTVYAAMPLLTGNATDEQVLAGRTFYNNDYFTKETGSMPNNGQVSITLQPGEEYYIPEGYHDGSGNVYANYPELSGNAYEEHVLSGKTFYNYDYSHKWTGSMSDNTGWTATGTAGQKTYIPEGYHDGNGYVSCPSSGGEMTSETLWTNPSPSSGFAAQTITLSKSITSNSYKYIGIEYRCSSSYANTMEILVTPTQLKNSGTTYYPTICLGAKVASSSGRRLRFVEYVGSTQLSFTTGYQNGSSTTSSGYAIPTKIKGYK